MHALFRRHAALALATLTLASAVDAHAQAKPPSKKKPAAEGGASADTVVTPGRQLDEGQRKKARYHMDFDKVDILEVIKYIAQWTNKNFILPENVRGKITIIGPTDVTAEEAYNAFIASLETNNLTVTPTGKFLKIVPKKDSIRTTIPTFLNDGTLPLNEQMVTKLIRLKYSDSDPIKNVIQQFVTREGEIVPFPPDVLIVSDDAQNITRVEELIGALDVPGSQDEINVLTVEHAGAQELANVLMQIFQQQGQAGGAGAQRKPTLALQSPVAPKEPGAPPAAGEAAATGTGGTKDSGASVSKIIPDERTNKIIVIGSPRTFERIKDLVKRLDVPTDSGQVHVYYLENADAEELAGTLSNLASGNSGGSAKKRGAGGATPGAAPAPAPAGGAGAAGATSAALFSGEVKVTAEKSTNSLLVIASPSDYRNMVKVIQQLDIRRRQVFIEAVIMEVKLNRENKFGIDLHTGYAFTDVQLPGTDKGVVPLILGSEVSNPGASLNLAGLASMSGFLAGIQGPPIKVDGLNVTLPSFGVVINALQKNSDVNVISTPHIMTSDNEDAEISVGSSVPFQTAVASNLSGLGSLAGLGTAGLSGSSAASAAGLLGGLGGLGMGGFGFGGVVPIQRQPVELRLKIKPQVNESDFVKLTIDEQIEEISSIDPQRGPTTAKRSVKTTVVAKDQSTVVIGGLIQDRITRGETKVPILGSLPLLGALFRNQSQIRERTNLLLFLTPYIIRDQSDFRRIFERKMKERQEFVARFFGTSEEYAVSVDYERKQGPLSYLRRAVKDEFDKAENGGPGAPNERVVTPPAPAEKPAEPAPAKPVEPAPAPAPAEKPAEPAPAPAEPAPANPQ